MGVCRGFGSCLLDLCILFDPRFRQSCLQAVILKSRRGRRLKAASEHLAHNRRAPSHDSNMFGCPDFTSIQLQITRVGAIDWSPAKSNCGFVLTELYFTTGWPVHPFHCFPASPDTCRPKKKEPQSANKATHIASYVTPRTRTSKWSIEKQEKVHIRTKRRIQKKYKRNQSPKRKTHNKSCRNHQHFHFSREIYRCTVRPNKKFEKKMPDDFFPTCLFFEPINPQVTR